jgi:hypothetical protein
MSDELTAVLAHGMLSSMSVLSMTFDLLRNDELDPDLRSDLGDLVDAQIALVVDVLRDLARGLPAEALLLIQSPRLTQLILSEDH